MPLIDVPHKVKDAHIRFKKDSVRHRIPMSGDPISSIPHGMSVTVFDTGSKNRRAHRAAPHLRHEQTRPEDRPRNIAKQFGKIGN